MIYANNEWLSAAEASDQLTLSKNSHKIFKARCDLKASDKCRIEYNIQFRDFIKHTSNNDGNLPCIFCSRTKKFSGRNNPNTKYSLLNDNYFEEVDSENKAYLLGWIASDGHIAKRGFKIAIKQSDKNILERMKIYLGDNIPVRNRKTNMGNISSLEANSIKMSKDLCRLLKINPGKKSDIVRLPDLEEKYLWHFIRGYFDGDGTINDPNKTCKNHPVVSIRSSSINMLNDLKRAIQIKSYLTAGHSISWENTFAFPFLEKMYENATIWLPRKRKRFDKWKAIL